MGGEMDLQSLLRGMRASLSDEVFVFITLADRAVPAGCAPVMVYQESEGTTLIMERAAAEAADLDGVFPCRRITLEVHSALEAVGFLARITTVLAAEGMGVNPVAGFYHDHLFVPLDKAEVAMAALRRLAAAA